MTARAITAACVALAAVAASTSCAGDDRSCASVVSFAEPVLTIRQVTGPDGTAVGTVEVTGLRLDGHASLADVRNGLRYGREWTPGESTNSSDLHWNLRVSRGRLLCDVPCGFGSFTAEDARLWVASGGAQGTWQGRVTYDSAQGCGPTLDDGVDVELDLRR